MTSHHPNETLLVKACVINHLIYQAAIELSSVITLLQQYNYPMTVIDYITHFFNHGAVILDIEYIRSTLYPPPVIPQDPDLLLASEIFGDSSDSE